MTSIPEFVTVERRKVKHARLKVSESGQVLLIVPSNLPQAEVERIYAGKRAWVAEKREFFATREKMPPSMPDQLRTILLHGEHYALYFEGRLGRRTRLNHDKKVVTSGRDLTDPLERNGWYRQQARRHFRQRVAQMAKVHGFAFNRVYIRDQSTKWGNCSRLGNISLNWRLIKAPIFVSDYVILHELLHTAFPKHSSAFWARLRALCPEFHRATHFLETELQRKMLL